MVLEFRMALHHHMTGLNFAASTQTFSHDLHRPVETAPVFGNFGLYGG
jgi:hypothetical protein